MSTHATIDQESFQKLLASAFVVQQSPIRDRLLARRAALATGAAAVATPAPLNETPSAAGSRASCSATFRVGTCEPKTARVRLRDPWMPLLLSLVIALALLVIWMLGRATWPGTAQLQGPPLQVTATPDAAPVQPEQVGQASPSPPPAIRRKSMRPETGSDSLVVYQNGRVIFRLKSSHAHGQSSALDSGAASARKTNLRLLHRIEPKYPEAAKQQHIQGSVVLEAKVSKGGTVQQLTVISGNSILATAASGAVRKWRFQPLVQNGGAVPFQTRIKVNFVLP